MIRAPLYLILLQHFITYYKKVSKQFTDQLNREHSHYIDFQETSQAKNYFSS